jgi:hypothetical protein
MSFEIIVFCFYYFQSNIDKSFELKLDSGFNLLSDGVFQLFVVKEINKKGLDKSKPSMYLI